MNKPRLLIVEDEAVIAADLAIRLTQLGYQVVGTAASGEAALALAARERPDLVLMDIHLQGALDGIAVAREMRTRLGLLCVFLTAHATGATFQRSKESEPYGYILKPFEDRDLETGIELALLKRQTERHAQERDECHRPGRETTLDGYWLVDPAGRLLEVNDTYCRMSGYDEPELLAMGVADLEANEPAADLAARLRQLMAQGEARFESRHRRKDGSPFDVEVSVHHRPATGGRLVAYLRDITARKQAETAAREREAQLLTLLEAAADGMLAIDNAGQVIHANHRLAELWEIPQSLMERGDDWATVDFALNQLADPDEFLGKVQALHNSDAADTDTVSFKDGRVFERVSMPLFCDGVRMGRMWSFRDITARTQAERANRASEERYRVLFERASDGIFLLSADGELLAVNEAFARMHGYRTNELLPASLMDLDGSASCQVGAERMRRLLAGAALTFETERTHRDGHLFQLEVSTRLVSCGGKTFLQCVHRDITERKRAEHEARSRACREPDPIALAVDGMLVGSPEGVIVEANDRLCTLLAAPREALLGKRLSEVLGEPATPDPEAADVAALRPGERVVHERRIVRPDGGETCVESHTLRRPDGGYQAVCHDITARQRAVAELEVALRERTSRLKELRHRVKNNLQVISSLLRLQGGRLDNPVAKAALLDMQHRVRSMALIDDHLCRAENQATVDLATYLKSLCQQLFRALAATPGAIQLQLNLTPVHLRIDEAIPVGLLVTELVSNALKHAFPQSAAGEVRVDLQPVAGGAGWCLRVADTGVGLPPDFALDRPTSLGMQLVSDLTRQIGGKLAVGTGPGATFTVVFGGTPA